MIKQKLARIERDLAQSYEEEAKSEERRTVDTINKNPKYFFQVLKKKRKITSMRTTIGPLKYNGYLTSDPHKMSETLNHQYVSAFSTPKLSTVNQWHTTTPPAESQLSDVESDRTDIETSIR